MAGTVDKSISFSASQSVPRIPRQFKIGIDTKRNTGATDPTDPFIQKGSESVATKIVAADGSAEFTDIQQAIDALPAGGGVVYIKEGTYYLSSTMTLSSNVAVIGAGRSTIIRYSGASVSAILSATGKTGILLESFFLDGTDADTDGVLIFFNTCSGCFVRDIWIANWSTGEPLIALDDSKTIIVTGCNMSSSLASACVQSGYNAAKYGSLCVISNNYFEETYYGVRIVLGDGNIIMGNVFSSHDVGVAIASAACDKNVIVGNVFVSCIADISDLGTGSVIDHNALALVL